ncbi:hypothetical protein HH303_15560 [Rhodospirillaceae bacterium KN72]|uniref:Uncharacterized protein n=1 Tax=Pacificispira spongiicola TaxID=2729598 RepID=A0A7Y0E2B1_9PROT|nr:hypothetical protein [Pacificispira spongiicola]NMM45914.1 hypothetical protein [Pacificispira spongiicola]
MKPFECIFHPKKGVGPINFGQSFTAIKNIRGFKLKRFDPDPDTPPTYDNDPLDLTVYQDEDGKVRSISCDEYLYVDGENIIGMQINDALRLLGNPQYELEKDFELWEGEVQDIYNIEALGMSLWTTSDGEILSASLDDGDYED